MPVLISENPSDLRMLMQSDFPISFALVRRHDKPESENE